ncbi:MAG: hypothetical protein NVS2B8_01860 [Vulcanimicrobiaceae bacterium]
MLVFRRSIATLVLTIVGFGAGAFTASASAQTAPPGSNVAPDLRGERGSRHDIAHAERRVLRLIASLEHDQRDYGGHRVRAIALLRQAEGELQAAVRVDKTTPR